MIADLPFGSYQAGPDVAYAASAAALKAGAAMVKLEGGAWLAPTVEYVTAARWTSVRQAESDCPSCRSAARPGVEGGPGGGSGEQAASSTPPTGVGAALFLLQRWLKAVGYAALGQRDRAR